MSTIKQKIKADVRQSSYAYYKNTDLYFRDYIYGDNYYVTLEDVIYRFLTTNDYEFDYNLGSIDIDQLVNDLYLHFIKTDKKFIEDFPGSTDRHRKNYIMKSLRNSTKLLLTKQFKENEVVAQQLQEFSNSEDLHYISIYSQDGGLLEDLSHKIWEKEKSKTDEIEMQKRLLAKAFKILTPLERKVLNLVIKNNTYRQIANYFKIDQSEIRKIIYSATNKLENRYSFKRQCA